MTRRIALGGLLAPLALALGPTASAPAADPPGAEVSPAETRASWQGEHYPAGTFATAALCADVDVADLRCDHFRLRVGVEPGYWDTHPGGGVRVRIAWDDEANDFDLYVYDADTFELVDSSARGGTSEESVFIAGASGEYDVVVVPFTVVDSGYAGEARFRSRALGPGPPRIRRPGPCTRDATRSMPDGGTHDHGAIDQHRFSCRMRQVFFDSLRDELADEDDVVLGEMDVEAGIAAIAVAFPESGALFFDVSDPARPRFLSWYRGSKCEELALDNDCGAFVDLSDDGTVAFLSVQSLTFLPASVPDPGVRPVSLPGVEVLDLRDPRSPALSQTFPVISEGGVHTSRSHVIPGRGSGPRVPGEYVFSIANGLGVQISRLERGGGPSLTQVHRIDLEGAHDTFIQNDRLSGRTYLYVAPELETGFYVYDVTDPANPRLLAEWDLTPQCNEDWYSHTVDVATRRGRRYVTVDAETFDLGPQSAGEPAGCGEVFGNGDKPGPLWIVDATNLGRLGPAQDSEEDDVAALQQASERALIASWTNPAGRVGGNLRFSPHNQQIVGDRIYLSHYHGGVYVLDASAAFDGRRVRPREVGFIVPHGGATRPLHEAFVPPLMPFFSDVDAGRPMIWDAVHYRGHVIAADMFGGLYSLRSR